MTNKNTKRKTLSKKVRQDVLNKTKGRCAYCGCHLENRFYVDHIEPLASDQGTNEISNLFASCFHCNSFKMTFRLEEFRREMQMQANRAFKYSRNFRMAEKFGIVQITEKPIEFYFEKIGIKL